RDSLRRRLWRPRVTYQPTPGAMNCATTGVSIDQQQDRGTARRGSCRCYIPATVRLLPPVLSHRDFRLFWIGAVLSATGTQFTTVAMAWQIYQITNSPLQVGLLGLGRAIPQITLAVFGGLLADA